MNLRSVLILAVGIAALDNVGAGQPNLSQKGESMLLNKPYFTMRISAHDCRYVAEVNGAFVQENKDGTSLTVSIPINHWMRTGPNELALSILTFKGKRPISNKAHCEVSLQVRPDEGTEAQTTTISRLVFSGELARVGKGTEESTPAGNYDSNHQFMSVHSGDVTIAETTIESDPEDKESKIVHQTVSLSTPFPEWAFFKSDTLPDVDPMTDAEYDHYVDSLTAYYKRIYDALKAKNVDSILPMFEERNRETDQAFYFPPGTTAKKIAAALKSSANDSDLELLGVKSDYLMTYTYDNRKLIELVREDDHPAIVFNIRGGGSVSYPIIFRKQGNQWIITR